MADPTYVSGYQGQPLYGGGYQSDAEQHWWNPTDWGKPLGIGANDPANADRQSVRDSAGNATAWGKQAQQGYAQNGAGLQNTLGSMAQTQNYYRDQMNGGNSVSQIQLNQAAANNMASQQSMARSAAPQNSVMAARTAANNNASINVGLAGQQAQAGIQERNAAAQNLGQSQNAMGQLQLNARGQDAGAVNGAYSTAAQGYGAAMNKPQNTWGSTIAGGAGGAAAGIMSLFSDERLKTNVSDGDKNSNDALGKLNAYKFDYKDQKHGAGRQLGILAQDLEKAGLGHTIIEKAEGKAVDTGRLSLANTAMLASLHKRLSKVEGK